MKKLISVNNQNTLVHQYEFAFSDPLLHPFTALVGGYGCGKTESIPLKWVKTIEFRQKRNEPCIFLVVEPTHKMIKNVAVKAFDKYFKRFGIKGKYHKTDHEYTISWNGRKYTCMLASAQIPEHIAGLNITDACLDEFDILREEAQEDIYNIVISRLREAPNGTLSIVTTPEGYRFTHKLYCEQHANDPKYKLIKAKTTDNFFLPPSYIESLYSQFDALLVRRYIDGEFVNLNNMAAYYAFLRDKNVKPLPAIQPGRLLIGIDFNVNPMTAAVCQQADNNILVKSEYYIRNSNTSQLCQAIRGDFPDHEIIACPDMTGKNRKTSADITDLQILQRYGFQILGFNKNITERGRLNIVNNMLDKKRLLVDPSCVHVIKDLEQVTTNEQGFIPKKADDPLTHISDALGYVCVALENKAPLWGIR